MIHCENKPMDLQVYEDPPTPKENEIKWDGIYEPTDVSRTQLKDQAMIQEIMATRRNLIMEKCKERTSQKLPPASTRTKVSTRLIHMPSKNVIWCPVYKSSTSSWLTYLLDISGLSDKEKIRRQNQYGLEGRVNRIYFCLR